MVMRQQDKDTQEKKNERTNDAKSRASGRERKWFRFIYVDCVHCFGFEKSITNVLWWPVFGIQSSARWLVGHIVTHTPRVEQWNIMLAKCVTHSHLHPSIRFHTI